MGTVPASSSNKINFCRRPVWLRRRPDPPPRSQSESVAPSLSLEVSLDPQIADEVWFDHVYVAVRRTLTRLAGRARFNETERVRVSADPGDPADLGNDSLPDAVAGHARNDALQSDTLAASTAVCYREGSKHDHRYIHAAPTRPRRPRRLSHTYASRVAVGNRPPPPGRSASPDEARQTFAPSAAT